jgi:uncharacterized membrane protein
MNFSVGNVIVTTIHIISAILAVGGVAFFRFAVIPYAATLPESERGDFLTNIRKRYIPILHGSFALLVLTGIHHITRIIRGGLEFPTLLKTKIVIALIIVFIGVALTTSKGFEGIKKNAPAYLTINLVLAAIVVFLGIWVTHR